jgi:hypothetical protein
MCRMICAIALACLLLGCSKKEDGGSPNPPGPNPQAAPTPLDPKAAPNGPNIPLSAEPDLSKVDFVVTAKVFIADHMQDWNSANTKYKGKKCELSGTLDFCLVKDRDIQVAFADIPPGHLLYGTFHAAETEETASITFALQRTTDHVSWRRYSR